MGLLNHRSSVCLPPNFVRGVISQCMVRISFNMHHTMLVQHASHHTRFTVCGKAVCVNFVGFHITTLINKAKSKVLFTWRCVQSLAWLFRRSPKDGHSDSHLFLDSSHLRRTSGPQYIGRPQAILAKKCRRPAKCYAFCCARFCPITLQYIGYSW